METALVLVALLAGFGCAAWLGYCLGRVDEADVHARAAEHRAAEEALAESRKAQAGAEAQLAEINAVIDRLQDRAALLDREPSRSLTVVNGRLGVDGESLAVDQSTRTNLRGKHEDRSA